jgi:hypothetical protein
MRSFNVSRMKQFFWGDGGIRLLSLRNISPRTNFNAMKKIDLSQRGDDICCPIGLPHEENKQSFQLSH